MELWIKSQDKEMLIKVDRIGIEEYTDGYGIVTYERIGTKKEFGLGLYKTKERALEVLDEIQKYLTPTIQMLDETIGDKKVCQVGNIMTFVYEMPNE